MSTAHFSIERLASLRAQSVDTALARLLTPAAPPSVLDGARCSLSRRALFACMVEQCLAIPLALLGVGSVLLIDDEPAVLRSTSRVLRQAAPDLELMLADGPRDGLARAAAQNPDAILLDAYMPEISGVDVCARLRAARATQHIPVLAMTADPSPELAAAFARAGAIAFLEKPVDAPALFEVLSAQLVQSTGDW